MKRPLLIAIAFLSLTACARRNPDSDNLGVKIDNLKTGEVVTVAKLPDGSDLKVTAVDLGWTIDRVYFTEHSVSAVENCGKNCVKTVAGDRL
jgi:type IV pilus biogenesis protein CpaD/CtpE